MPLPLGYGCGTATGPSWSTVGSGTSPQPLERSNGTRRALAIANASLAAHFDLQDRLAGVSPATGNQPMAEALPMRVA
ncbi:MAG: hypothetical protein ABR987_00545 [Terracidiphilus sp.]